MQTQMPSLQPSGCLKWLEEMCWGSALPGFPKKHVTWLLKANKRSTRLRPLQRKNILFLCSEVKDDKNYLHPKLAVFKIVRFRGPLVFNTSHNFEMEGTKFDPYSLVCLTFNQQNRPNKKTGGGNQLYYTF